MLTKLLVATVVFLEMLKAPAWVVSPFEKPLLKNQEQATENKELNPSKIDFEQIPVLPTKKPKIKEPLVYADGAMVIDVSSSKILYQKNGQKKFPIASLTKIMTALVVLENYELNAAIIVPREAVLVSGAKINLREGEEMTVSNLLYGLLLYSGNDAARTLTSKMGEKEFVAKMNQKAKRLGLLNLHYADSAGLDAQNIATLKDLGLLTVFALRKQTFAKIVATNEIEIISIDGRIKHPLKNTNRLLRDYPGTFGVKTGYTEEAGHCLITAVSRDGHQVLSLVLAVPDDQFRESRVLLDWAFSAYQW